MVQNSDVILTMCIMLSENNLMWHNSQNTDLSKQIQRNLLGKASGWIFEFFKLEVLEDIFSYLVTMLIKA